jgi:hypothetical protein
VFHLGVAKVDLDVTFVVIATHVCCKCMFEMFDLFQKYVTIASSRCCKSRSGCCICCNDYVYVLNILSV